MSDAKLSAAKIYKSAKWWREQYYSLLRDINNQTPNQADRIEKLEAALREIAEMTEGYGRSSELLVGIKLVAENVLEGKDD